MEEHLRNSGIKDEQIIEIKLDDIKDAIILKI